MHIFEIINKQIFSCILVEILLAEWRKKITLEKAEVPQAINTLHIID